MMIGMGVALPLGGRVLPWAPSTLGASLLGWIDAEQPATITQAATLVSAWTDSISPGSRSFAQATGTLKPVYNAAGLNSRPSIVYDGIDDETTLASVPYPTSGAFEIWALVKQDALAADATVRTIIAWGNGTGATTLSFRRNVVTGVNRAQAAVGNGTVTTTITNNVVDFSGVCVVRLLLDGVNGQIEVNGTAGTPAAIAPASLSTTRTRIGASASTSANVFFQGGINNIAITTALSVNDAALMLAYQKARGGL
jgi:hypothetical protein